MNYELKGNFGEIKDQLEYLEKRGIDVVMNDGKFQFADLERAYAGYKRIVDEKIEGYEAYVDDLKKIASILKLHQKMLDSKDETLTYEKDDNYIVIDGGNKGIVLSKIEEEAPFCKYEIKFLRRLDNKSDKTLFYFKNDDILYKPISEFASSYDNMIKLENKKIEFVNDLEGMFLIYESKINEDVLQDTIKVDGPYDDKNFLNVDLLYTKLDSRISKGMMK